MGRADSDQDRDHSSHQYQFLTPLALKMSRAIVVVVALVAFFTGWRGVEGAYSSGRLLARSVARAKAGRGAEMPGLIGLAPLEPPSEFEEKALKEFQTGKYDDLVTSATQNAASGKSGGGKSGGGGTSGSWPSGKKGGGSKESGVTGSWDGKSGGQWCFNSPPWVRHKTANRAYYGAALSVSAYDIKSRTSVLPTQSTVTDQFTTGKRGGSKVVYVGKTGATKYEKFTAPFFVSKWKTVYFFSVRGTAGMEDAFRDADATFVDFAVIGSGGKRVLGAAHRGFASLVKMQNVVPVYEKLRGACPRCEWRFSGHSLGGAVVQLAALLYHLKYGGPKVEVYTIGSPRVADLTLGAKMKQHMTHYRFKNQNDLVPSVPTKSTACIMTLSPIAVPIIGPALVNSDDAKKQCALQFKHSAAVSVRLYRPPAPLQLSNSGINPMLYRDPFTVMPIEPQCIAEDNSHAGYSVPDHSSSHYLAYLKDMVEIGNW